MVSLRLELNFTGSSLLSAADHQSMRKILNLFASARTLILKNTGVKDLAHIGEILCSKWLKCKRLDLTGHGVTKEELLTLIDILEGRSLTKDVTPFWLAVGNVPELLKNTSCNPYTGDGCNCKSKKVVHVVANLQAPTVHTTVALQQPLRRARRVPLPPKESPPLPPKGILNIAGDYAAAQQQLRFCIEQERVRGRTVMCDGVDYVLVTHKGHFALVDFTKLEKGLVWEMGGAWLRVEDTRPTSSDKEGIVSARAGGEFYVGIDQCPTPDSYLCTGGGESIKIRLGDFTIDGWVAATLSDRVEWRWLPLNKCIV